MVHYLKATPEFYRPLVMGVKTFEIRRNDRDYEIGDILVLREWRPVFGYSNKSCTRRVTYLTAFEQQPGYIVMALVAHPRMSGQSDDLPPPHTEWYWSNDRAQTATGPYSTWFSAQLFRPLGRGWYLGFIRMWARCPPSLAI